MHILYQISLVLCCFTLISCESNCHNFDTCGGCIGYAFDRCVWCAAKNHSERRCQSKSTLPANATWCGEAVYDPEFNKNVISNENFNTGQDGMKTVQFRPQSIKIKARPGVPVDFMMSYKPATDYPLDLYYLMDYSKTMQVHATTLMEQGYKIYKELRKLTNNVRLGIGSFIEKPALPYADISVAESYSFKNHLSLTDNMTLFERAINETLFGSNYDDPEAGFDALMQAMVCIKEIGWRENSRRIIVLSTDSTYHSAGDGKFVGAVLKNDMQCHLDGNIYGDMSLKFDYPSVGQINNIASKNNFKIIFAVEKKVMRDYKALEKKIQGSKYVELKTGSKIVDMIKKEYLELVRTITLDAYNIPSLMELNYEPDCSSGACNVEHNKTLNIKGTLTVKSCPENKEVTHSLMIGPLSLNEKLNIEIEIDCECECEKVKNREENSKLCSENGTYQCGVCKCNENRSGDICQCVGNSVDTGDRNKCKANNDIFPCSMFGTCRCGKCECPKGFSGAYCEFNDNACPSPGGLICAGHGNCSFGRCICEPHWTGEGCKCPENRCMAPYSQEICSGNGDCVCGECKCKPMANNNICSGKFCDDCEELAAKRCKELEEYAYCNYNANKTICDEKFNHTDTEVILVNKTEIYSADWYMAKMWCRKYLDDGRILVFKYHYPNSTTTSSLLLIIQNELDMKSHVNLWIAGGSVLGSVLLIGLGTVLIWKVLIDMYDRREYQNFIKSSTAAGYNVENVVYNPPIVTYRNPMCESK
ncbi:integrin beta pat-3-like [Danaus plexippus]|uniref:Integrin beta n=1 Tax=Danaus plexippus plexippus TaxID=278856 RepID=A0A212FB66_DANPL|nr:integrin beta pat-3-like [Danaus plexippus]OWR50970.1 integrin beta 1 [Danaus plexippus plexippus]